MQLGKLGVWTATDGMSAEQAALFARRVEQWGYSALWIPEAFGRNVLTHAAWLLARTESLILASGIANIYGRDPVAMASAQLTLDEQSGGRFLLGIGVSHPPLVQDLRGHAYDRKPVAHMRDYLQAMSRLPYAAPKPAERPRTVIAALGPEMAKLGAELADGVHPYNVTPEHTARTRAIIGPDKWLCVEQKVLLETDAVRARAAARKNLSIYMPLDNYVRNWRRLGFGDADFADGGSDRFLDAMVVWGDEAAIRSRIEQHWNAGADHVCIQPIHLEGDMRRLDETVLERLAPALNASRPA
jgi:probable F420-dependent oxidoreductase